MREIISGKLNDPGEVFQKHNSKKSYLHIFTMFPQTHMWGEMHPALQRLVPQHTLPPANSVQTSAPSSHSLVPQQAPQSKHLPKQLRDLLGHHLEETSLLQKDDEQNNRTTTPPSFSGTAQDTNCFLWTQSVWQTTHLQPCPEAARTGLLQGKGRVRSWVWPLCPPWCIPQHPNILGRTCCRSQSPSTVMGTAKRPGPESDI